MQSLYYWAMSGRIGVFRTQDFLIRRTPMCFEVRYRSPLWSRLPAQIVGGFYDVSVLLGEVPDMIMGTVRR